MKKLMMIVMFAGMMVFAGCGSGSKHISQAVPNKVLEEFHEDFPLAKDVDWEMRNGLYKANFEMLDKDMEAAYTSDGDRVSIGI
jgi:hypothetical protein